MRHRRHMSGQDIGKKKVKAGHSGENYSEHEDESPPPLPPCYSPSLCVYTVVLSEWPQSMQLIHCLFIYRFR